MTVSRALVLGTLCAAMVGLACGGGGGGGPSNSLAKSAGDNQIGNAGAALPNPLAVVVRDGANNPVQGTTVSWSVVTGGGSVTPSSVTDASGIATATRTLGSDSIVQTTTASGTGLSGSPVTFSATARIQGATQMQLNGAGDGQTDTIGATLATAYAVLVRDETSTPSTPVAGVTVNWSAAGGGSVSAPTSVTTASGIATVNRILGTTAGAQTAQARVPGLNGNPVSFTATATAGNATAIEKTPEPTSGVINSMVTYTVTARDRANNPKSGVVIDWAATGGGGSITTPSTTGTNGQATAQRTLSGTAGPHTATATANGIAGAPSVGFSTNAVNAPLTAAVTVGPGIVFAPTNVTIARTGVVTWTWAGGPPSHSVQWQTGPMPLPPNSTIQASGMYQHTFNTAGTYTYDCAVHGSAMSGTVTVVP